MIQNIVFDMGNVLIPFEPEKYLRVFVEREEDRTLLFYEVFRSLEWLKTDSGDLTVPQAVQAVQARMPERLHAAIANLFHRWGELFEPYADMEKLAHELKDKGYKLYLLSNISAYYHQLRKRIPAVACFDGEFLSAEHRMMKPYPEIYRQFLKEYSLNAEECFFIDDLPVNVYGASKAGIDGTVYHGSVEQLRHQLKEKGILR